MMESWLTAEETAAALKVQVRTIRTWLRNGTLQGRKLGRVWRIPESELHKLSSNNGSTHNTAREDSRKVS